MVRDRFSARAKSRRKKKFIVAGVFAAVLLILAGIAWAAWSSSWLAAKEVRVVGVEHISASEITAVAQVPIGTSLLQIDLAKIEKNVAELDIVKTVEVRRSLPNTIIVTVGERQAVAWTMRNGNPWAVDAEGIVYRQLQKKPKHIPRLDAKKSKAELLQATALVAADLSVDNPGVFSQVKSISAKSKDSIELQLKGGKTVLWGGVENAEQKARTLSVLLTVPAQHYDVSAPERPTTRE